MNMFLISAFVLCLSLGVGYGFNCRDLSGTWQNQLGSNMTIVHLSENQITGEYKTAVETKQKAAFVTSAITGLFVPVSDGALLSFTVLFNHGKSLTSWVGQCMVCEGDEILFTSWILRSHSLKPTDKWMANLVNQDTFKRIRDNYIETPMLTQGPSPRDIKSASCEKNLKAGVSGHWLSTSGDYLQFKECSESGVLSGTNQGIPFIGRKDGGGHFTALGFASAASDTIRGWTGHIYESSLERLRAIETSWLSHSFSTSCKDPRASVQYGMDNYIFSYGYKDTTSKPKLSWTQVATNYVMSLFN